MDGDQHQLGRCSIVVKFDVFDYVSKQRNVRLDCRDPDLRISASVKDKLRSAMDMIADSKIVAEPCKQQPRGASAVSVKHKILERKVLWQGLWADGSHHCLDGRLGSSSISQHCNECNLVMFFRLLHGYSET